jgi:hypothetical protein
MSEMLNMNIFFKKEFKLPTGRYIDIGPAGCMCIKI